MQWVTRTFHNNKMNKQIFLLLQSTMLHRKRELWHYFWTYSLLLLVWFYIKLFALWMIKELCTFQSKLNIGVMSQHSFLIKLPCKQDSICKMKMRNSCITGLCKIKPCLHTVWICTWRSRDIPKTTPAFWKWKATISFMIFYVSLKQNVVHGPIGLSMG